MQLPAVLVGFVLRPDPVAGRVTLAPLLGLLGDLSHGYPARACGSGPVRIRARAASSAQVVSSPAPHAAANVASSSSPGSRRACRALCRALRERRPAAAGEAAS
ncbi:hypothetical protein [Streptomyces scabiei]|uniref:hypothetical protein n=1 Tax=Streptomyces scabiei TaxID=1930 RepID=UPI0029C9FD1F|nr:hypothetical protein [Streptomyces scabiei]